MKVIIQDIIIYNSEDASIHLMSDVSSDNDIILTPTANRLLMLLLKHQGTPLDKDIILIEAWDKFGLKGSYSSLNQYISQLRKVFSSLIKDHEVIQTVPHVGFMISNTIKIEHKDNFKLKSKKIKIKTIIAIFIVIIILISTLSNIVKESKKSHLIGTIKNCNVYNLQPRSIHTKNKQYKIISMNLEKIDLPCSGNEVFFIHTQSRVLEGRSGRIFISRCNRNDTNLTKCDNIYYQNIEITDDGNFK